MDFRFIVAPFVYKIMGAAKYSGIVIAGRQAISHSESHCQLEAVG
jgi:hypothetical protein